MQKLVGYAIAGGLLLVIADVAPGFAVGTAGLILLATALNKSGQLTALSKFIKTSTGS